LGIDSSFASIAIARHLALGCDYSGKIRFPEDLLKGVVSREIPLNVPKISQTEMPADYVVGLLEQAPLAPAHWDLSIVLNAIDMLEKPEKLPELQAKSLRKGGVAIQSCPYIWHESVAARRRGKIPKTVNDSARAVEWVYEQAGFKILQSFDQIPWLFFKHIRQIELYSVHFFVSKKTGT
jgi:SAM-dependent methyltransferase